jgi:hypothetical protein
MEILFNQALKPYLNGLLKIPSNKGFQILIGNTKRGTWEATA